MPQWSEQYGRLVKFSTVQWLRNRGGSCSGVCQSTRTTRPLAGEIFISPARAAGADTAAARTANARALSIGLRLIHCYATARIARHRADRQSTGLPRLQRAPLRQRALAASG